MKKNILAAAAAMLLPLMAQAGEITAGSVPRSINYQGRLERDNAPITGTIHLRFRIYNSPTASGAGPDHCSEINQPCLWKTPAPGEVTVEATQGVFSANLVFTAEELQYVFSGTQQKYLEVQVESDVLSPREPINSVVYALVAKKLEDGSSVSVSSFTANYQVLLATAASSRVGIGTNSPEDKLHVAGGIKITGAGNGITFPNGTVLSAAGVYSAVGSLTSDDFATIRVDNANTGAIGDVIFNTPIRELARIKNSGDTGIGTDAPMGKLDVNGSLYVGNEGIYDRTDGELNVKQDLWVEGGRVKGNGSNYLSLGETADTIVAATANTDRLWLDSSGNLGVGAGAPAGERVYAAGNIRSNTGVRGSSVSVGGYSGWVTSYNEVRSMDGTHLLLQQNNPYYVGVGTQTPKEKLHINGTVLADFGVKAATGVFTSDVVMNGNLTANGNNKQVFLTSTTVYGDLSVYGRISLPNTGFPAYLTSTQTFTGLNIFQNRVMVSSDILTVDRIGAGVTDFDFPGTKYLQVGDAEFVGDNAMAYLVGGQGADAKLNFYRAGVESARIETQGGRNLAVVVQGQTKTLTDANYHRIQNSVLWVSTGYASTPAISASSVMGNVGMGTTVLDPNWRLTVEGNLRISTTSSPGQSYGIIVADGTEMHTAKVIGSANSVSSNGNAVIQADAGMSGVGDVLLRAGSVDGLILNSGGNVGIGTVNPVSKLNVRGGDLVLGTPVNPYAVNNQEDLIVGGHIVFDGALIQRSASAVELSNLVVSNSVFLSTATGAKTAIGSAAVSPTSRLYVAGGDIDVDSGYGIRVNETAPVRQYLRGDGTHYVPSLIVAQDIPAAIARTTTTLTGTLPLAVDGGASGDISANRTLSIGGLSTLGTGNYAVGVNAAGTGWEYKQLIPTAEETTIAHSAGGITIGIDGPLKVANGGSGLAALTQGDILYYGAAAATTMSVLPKNTTSSRYISNSGANNNPAWAQVDLTDGVTGVLPLANGGTGGLLTTQYGGTGTNLSAKTVGAIPYFSALGVINALNAGAANQVLQANGAAAPSWITATNSATADTIVRRDVNGDFSGNTITAVNFVGNVGGRARSIYDVVGLNDYIRVRGDDTGNNNGYLEIATADDGTEPVYVRQYTGEFLAIARTATLLDASGNSSFPGTVSVGGLTCTNCINLAGGAEVTGTLPVANGGTGKTSLNGAFVNGADLTATGALQYLRRNSTNSGYEFAAIAAGELPAHNHSTADLNAGTLGVNRGGTGRATLTNGSVLVGNDAAAVTLVAGQTANYTVVVDTFPYTCSQMQFTNGILVNVVGAVCP